MRTGDELFLLQARGVTRSIVVAVARDGAVTVTTEQARTAFPVDPALLVAGELHARAAWRAAKKLVVRQRLGFSDAVRRARGLAPASRRIAA